MKVFLFQVAKFFIQYKPHELRLISSFGDPRALKSTPIHTNIDRVMNGTSIKCKKHREGVSVTTTQSNF